jgi:hypothetical protein
VFVASSSRLLDAGRRACSRSGLDASLLVSDRFMHIAIMSTRMSGKNWRIRRVCIDSEQIPITIRRRRLTARARSGHHFEHRMVGTDRLTRGTFTIRHFGGLDARTVA